MSKTDDIVFQPVPVLIYGAPSDIAGHEFRRSRNGEVVFEGELALHGLKWGLGLFVHGGDIYQQDLGVVLGPPDAGWNDYLLLLGLHKLEDAVAEQIGN